MPQPDSHNPVTFMMVGCQRCGTTWIDAALRGHPEVFLPAQKQTYFFDRNLDRGLAWYLDQFADATEQHTAVGEIATGYCLPHAVPHLAKAFPNIKIMMAMRHPVDRAYSNFLVRQHEEGWSSFRDAINNSPDLLDRGRYIEQIEGMLEHYPRERMLFLLYDDLKRDDRAYLRSILEFIGVDASYESPQLGRQRNAAIFPGTRRLLHRAGLKPLVVAMSKGPVGDLIRRMHKRFGRASSRTMPLDIRAELLDYYRPHNERLSAFLGRDLSNWNI